MEEVILFPIDDLSAVVKERDAALIEHETAMFWAARDRAAIDDERRYWDEFLGLRERNLAHRARTEM